MLMCVYLSHPLSQMCEIELLKTWRFLLFCTALWTKASVFWLNPFNSTIGQIYELGFFWFVWLISSLPVPLPLPSYWKPYQNLLLITLSSKERIQWLFLNATEQQLPQLEQQPLHLPTFHMMRRLMEVSTKGAALAAPGWQSPKCCLACLGGEWQINDKLLCFVSFNWKTLYLWGQNCRKQF